MFHLWIISNHNHFLFFCICFSCIINYNFSKHIMYVLPHLCVAKDFWSFKILNQFWKVLWIFKVLQFHIFQGMTIFLIWFLSSWIFRIKCVFIIWVLLIILCKIDSYLTHWYSFLKVLNQNLNLKFHQMDFWFEFLDIHMNKKTITSHDCHGFKWQNINIYLIYLVFLCNLTPFLVHWIVTTPNVVSFLIIILFI